LKAKLDQASGVSGWTLHDIRRTFASLVADTGANAIIVDRILGHTGSATLSQVAMIYQRSEFAEQKREVITTWANVIRNAAAIAKGANVIEIGCSA
jgi:integrase